MAYVLKPLTDAHQVHHELPPSRRKLSTSKSDNPRAQRPTKRPRTSAAVSAGGSRSGVAVETQPQNALGQIEEGLGVLKEELQANKRTSDNMKSDLNHARNRITALEEELRNLRDSEKRQRLESAAKIDDLSLQLTKQKAQAASDLSTAYQEINDCK